MVQFRALSEDAAAPQVNVLRRPNVSPLSMERTVELEACPQYHHVMQ
jgi:hypothetical protein